MAEEIIDFGFSAVTADEYERDNTDGENTGSGGSASPEALSAMDSKIERIMGYLADQAKQPQADYSDPSETLGEQLDDVELKIDKLLLLENEEARQQTTADILSQLTDVSSISTSASKQSGEVVGKQKEILDFLKSMEPKLDKILRLESLEALLENQGNKVDKLVGMTPQSLELPDMSEVTNKLDEMIPKIDKILKMESVEAIQSLQQSSSDIGAIVKEIEERKKDLNKTYKARMLAVEKLILPLIANLQKDGETKEYIRWPNRTDILEEHKGKILTVTRSEI
jgi:hypothetical protein